MNGGCGCTEDEVVRGCSVHWRGPVSPLCRTGQHGNCPGYSLVERPGVFRVAEWCGCSCGCTDGPAAA
jgi:hypothetical protein